MQEKTKIGLIGCGAWGKYILRDLVTLNCEVHVLCRSKESIARAEKGGATSIVDSIAAMPRVEGIIIASPTITHLDIIEQVAPLNIPVFTEKPMGIDIHHAKRLVDQMGERLFVMDKWRYHPGILELAKLAKNKELGEVCGLTLARCDWGCPHSDVDCVWILAPHDLSIALEILGEIPTPFHARATTRDKKIVSFYASLGNAPWVNISVSEIYPSKKREIRLECSHGVAILSDAYADSIAIYPRTEETGDENPADIVRLRKLNSEYPLLRELKAFIGFIHGGPPPKSSAKEALQIIETIDTLRNLAKIPDKKITLQTCF